MAIGIIGRGRTDLGFADPYERDLYKAYKERELAALQKDITSLRDSRGRTGYISRGIPTGISLGGGFGAGRDFGPDEYEMEVEYDDRGFPIKMKRTRKKKIEPDIEPLTRRASAGTQLRGRMPTLERIDRPVNPNMPEGAQPTFGNLVGAGWIQDGILYDERGMPVGRSGSRRYL